MDNQWSWDDFSNTVFGVFDKVNQGVTKWFDFRIAKDENKARAALARQQAQNAQTLDDLSVGSTASNWGNPDYNIADQLKNPQSLLILAAVGLVVVALVRK